MTIADFYECKECGYRISPIQMDQAGYPYGCPGCGLQNIYQFVYVPGRVVA